MKRVMRGVVHAVSQGQLRKRYEWSLKLTCGHSISWDGYLAPRRVRCGLCSVQAEGEETA